MSELREQPDIDQINLGAVLGALADPLRRSIVEQLLRMPEDGRLQCSSVGVGVARSTMTYHFKVLRESGLTAQYDFGNRAELALRRSQIDARFPGLLSLVEQNNPDSAST